jgi:ankyrin repeat protein
MEYLCARIVKWKRKKTTHKNTRIDEFSLQLFDAIYENKFELSKILIDDGKVDVNIKKDCGDTPLIATCQQTTLQNEEEAVKFIHYLWQSGSKFHTSDNLGKTAMDYAKGNGLMKIVQTLLYIHWNILYDNVCNVGLI